MGRTTVIPFGPQHPVLPDPLHLKLVVEDGTVVEAIPQLGFVHRGLESLVRNKVRFLETPHSMDIIREALNRLPDTELSVKVKGNPEGESIFRVEQTREELLYYLKANGSKMLDRFLCVYCSASVDTCPIHCLKQELVHRKPSVRKFLVEKRGTPPKKKSKE